MSLLDAELKICLAQAQHLFLYEFKIQNLPVSVYSLNSWLNWFYLSWRRLNLVCTFQYIMASMTEHVVPFKTSFDWGNGAYLFLATLLSQCSFALFNRFNASWKFVNFFSNRRYVWRRIRSEWIPVASRWFENYRRRGKFCIS